MPFGLRDNLNVTMGGIPNQDAAITRSKTEHVVARIKCLGDGATRRTDFGPDLVFRPVLVSPSLKANERQRILTLGRRPSERTTISLIAIEVARHFGWRPIKFEKLLIPASWYTAHPCFDVEIIFRILYKAVEVDFRAAAAVQIGNEGFAQDEEIGDMIVLLPYAIQYEVNRTYKKECCPRQPANPPAASEVKEYNRLQSDAAVMNLRSPNPRIDDSVLEQHSDTGSGD